MSLLDRFDLWYFQFPWPQRAIVGALLLGAFCVAIQLWWSWRQK